MHTHTHGCVYVEARREACHWWHDSERGVCDRVCLELPSVQRLRRRLRFFSLKVEWKEDTIQLHRHSVAPVFSWTCSQVGVACSGREQWCSTLEIGQAVIFDFFFDFDLKNKVNQKVMISKV